jgi:hypothetical protein
LAASSAVTIESKLFNSRGGGVLADVLRWEEDREKLLTFTL